MLGIVNFGYRIDYIDVCWFSSVLRTHLLFAGAKDSDINPKHWSCIQVDIHLSSISIKKRIIYYLDRF